ncbi:MAG: hypothetical protein ACREMD_04675 [Gemmatimonadota bacterium]
MEPVPGFAAWFKADAIEGLTDGDPVGLWEDSSSNNKDASQSRSGSSGSGSRTWSWLAPQLNLFANPRELAWERLIAPLDRLRSRYGFDAVRSGPTLAVAEGEEERLAARRASKLAAGAGLADAG